MNDRLICLFMNLLYHFFHDFSRPWVLCGVAFDVSINTLLGSPQKLICQCCGMPLDDSTLSRESDGSFNEDYCKWCYTDGKFVYDDLDALIDFLSTSMANESFPADKVREYLNAELPKLKYWKNS